MKLRCPGCGYVQPSTNPEKDKEVWIELVNAGVYFCPFCGEKMGFDEDESCMEVLV